MFCEYLEQYLIFDNNTFWIRKQRDSMSTIANDDVMEFSDGESNANSTQYDIIIDPENLAEFHIYLSEADIVAFTSDGSRRAKPPSIHKKNNAKTGVSINSLKIAFPDKSSFMKYEKQRRALFDTDGDFDSFSSQGNITTTTQCQCETSNSPYSSSLFLDRTKRPLSRSLENSTNSAHLTRHFWPVNKSGITSQGLTPAQQAKVRSMANIYDRKSKDLMKQKILLLTSRETSPGQKDMAVTRTSGSVTRKPVLPPVSKKSWQQ